MSIESILTNQKCGTFRSPHTNLLAVLAAILVLLGPGLLPAQDAADTTGDSKSELRTNAAAAATTQVAEEPDTNAPDSAATSRNEFRHGLHIDRNALVVIGRDVELKAGETAEAVVVVGGSAKIHGRVRDAVVVIGGDLSIDGEVGDAVVAVMGNVRAGEGAKIHGDVVAVGGKADIAEGAKVEGQTQEVDFGANFPQIEWLKKWFLHCVLKMRPLAPQVGWVWVIWGVFLLLYLLIAAAFPRPVQACVDELTRRPATSFLMGLLTKLLLPLVVLLLVIIVVGMIALPFILAALFLGLLVGKVAILEWLGFKLGRQFGGESFNKPLAALMIGAIIVTLLYLVPILGMITFAIVSVWGLGAAVLAAFGGLRREMPKKPAAPPTAPALPAAPEPVPTAPSAGGIGAMPAMPSPAIASEPQAASATIAPEAPPAEALPPLIPQPAGGGAAVAALPDAWAFPKAGFWERIGAAFLDVVLVSILGALVGGPPQGFLVALAYFAGMWTWRGTTIGGIVLGLKVARMDGQPLTFVVALVRGLAAAFSAIVLFLGFLWIAWDPDKQGWHDKIAGTVVVKLPRGTPLVCL